MYISLFERDVSRCSSNINGFFHQYHILKNNRGKGGGVNHKEQAYLLHVWGGGGGQILNSFYSVSHFKSILIRSLQTVGG